jgi:hypothetical protein
MGESFRLGPCEQQPSEPPVRGKVEGVYIDH